MRDQRDNGALEEIRATIRAAINIRIAIYLFSLVLVIPAILLLFSGIARSTDKPLNNDDVVGLVKAGLSDAIVIATISRSQAQFDLSPEALLKLKQAGVSNAVIEAMLSPKSGQGHEAPAQATSYSSTPLPTAYGYYVVEGATLCPLDPMPVTTILGLAPGGRLSGSPGWAVDGLKGEPFLSINTSSPAFIIYQQALPVNAANFSALEYTSSMQAYQFNVIGTGAQFFANVYGGMRPTDPVPIDLWQAKAPQRLRVEPIEGKADMFRFTVSGTLTPGRYALWLGNALHPVGTVFATAPSRTAAAFYFQLGEAHRKETGSVEEMISSLSRDAGPASITTVMVGAPFDAVWAAAHRVFKRKTLMERGVDEVATEDKDKGFIVTAPSIHKRGLGGDFKVQYIVVIERLKPSLRYPEALVTKLYLKAWCYDQRRSDTWVPWEPGRCNELFLSGLHNEGLNYTTIP